MEIKEENEDGFQTHNLQIKAQALPYSISQLAPLMDQWSMQMIQQWHPSLVLVF